MAEEEAAPEEEKKKGGKKKLIIKIVPLILIALVVAKMTVLKPPPPTPAQVEAKEKAAKEALATKCAIANDMKPPAPAKDDKGTTSTTVAATPPVATTEGPVLTIDSVTVNLADGHFLKVGIGLQLPMGIVLEVVKDENAGAKSLNYVITELRTKSIADLGPTALEPLRKRLGNQICNDNDGRFLTVYFTDFVSQ